MLPYGFLVCCSGGLYHIPDPSYVTYARFQVGGRANISGTSDRVVVCSSTGVFYSDGSPVATPVASPRAVIGLTTGELLTYTGADSIYWGDNRLSLPKGFGQLSALDELDENHLVIVAYSRRELLILDRQGKLGNIPLPKPAIAIAKDSPSGDLLVGTTDGAIVVSPRGEVRRSFGARPMMVVGYRGRAMYLDVKQDLYDVEGKIVAHLPFTYTNHVAEWNDKCCLGGQLADGRFWVGIVDFVTGKWEPLDLPLESPVLGIGSERGKLIVISQEGSMAVSDARLVAPFRVGVHFIRHGEASETVPELASDESEITLRLPPARVAPWRNPDYMYKVDGGAWLPLPAGGTMTINRLGWGTHRLQVRAAMATLATQEQYVFERPWPWWGRWPGWALEASTLGLAVWGLLRLRTQRLEQEKHKLELIVEQRTRRLEEANEALNRANAVKEDFIASLNHEIRTPLNGIVGITRMLDEAATEARRMMLMPTLHACVEQMRATVEGVLDFSAIRREAITLAEQRFELGALLASVCDAADAVGKRIRLNSPASSPIYLLGDAGKLRQIVGNYLTNAIKYGVPPGGEVCYEWRPEGNDRGQLHLTVTSTGPTLSAEELAQLFGMFIRGRRARETNARGTGLGLALCRRYARAMGGDTAVSSRDGATTFSLMVPFAIDHAPGAAAPVKVATPPGGHVLAVEDEPFNRLILGHYLGKMGFTVDWAPTIEQAMSLLARSRYSLVLTDWMLPDASGGELIRRLKAAHGPSAPPVVVLSAFSQDEKRQEAFTLGAKAYLTKPLDEAELRRTLAQIELAPLAGTTEQPAAIPITTEGLTLARLDQAGADRATYEAFVQEIVQQWQQVRSTIDTQPLTAATLVHRLRSQMMVVEAREVSEQLGILERGLTEGMPETPRQGLLVAIDAELQAVREFIQDKLP